MFSNVPQGVDQLPHHFLRPFRVQPRFAADKRFEAFAFDVLHDDVGGIVGAQKVAHLEEMRMIEFGERLGLGEEAPSPHS